MTRDWADEIAELICHGDICTEIRQGLIAACLREQRALGVCLGADRALRLSFPGERGEAEVSPAIESEATRSQVASAKQPAINDLEVIRNC